MTADRLRNLAAWFDNEQLRGRWPAGFTEVQDDLRELADQVEETADHAETVRTAATALAEAERTDFAAELSGVADFLDGFA